MFMQIVFVHVSFVHFKTEKFEPRDIVVKDWSFPRIEKLEIGGKSARVSAKRINVLQSVVLRTISRELPE